MAKTKVRNIKYKSYPLGPSLLAPLCGGSRGRALYLNFLSDKNLKEFKFSVQYFSIVYAQIM